jgi:phage/plasmid-like protein (TIGR03299 family)
MGHELYILDGKVSMMYVDEEPWHGLGTKLQKPATAEEAIEAAHLDWEVIKIPLVGLRNKQTIQIPNKFAIVPQNKWGRLDCPVFGIVGKQFMPLQNREAFQFFDPIAGQGAAIYHTAGALGEGERVWILAKLPESIQVIGDDITDKYLLLSNSHDGNSAVQIKFTPIRVVCNNTLTMALSRGPTLRVTHTKNIHERLRQAEKLLGIVRKRYSGIETSFKAMLSVQMHNGLLDKYLTKVFPDPVDPENEKAVRRVQIDREWSKYFFENGTGNSMSGVRGSLWAAYNGVAEFIDHRGLSYQTRDGRLNSVWFGDGYLVKARAFNAANQMCIPAS